MHGTQNIPQQFCYALLLKQILRSTLNPAVEPCLSMIILFCYVVITKHASSAITATGAGTSNQLIATRRKPWIRVAEPAKISN